MIKDIGVKWVVDNSGNYPVLVPLTYAGKYNLPFVGRCLMLQIGFTKSVENEIDANTAIKITFGHSDGINPDYSIIRAVFGSEFTGDNGSWPYQAFVFNDADGFDFVGINFCIPSTNVLSDDNFTGGDSEVLDVAHPYCPTVIVTVADTLDALKTITPTFF